jgi:hypothetical protein
MMEDEEYLREILRENAMESAPEDLIERVLNTVERDSAPLTEREPLISIKGWVGIALGILSLTVLALLPVSFIEQLTQNPMTSMELPQYIGWDRFRFPDFSKTTLMGIIAFAIFGLLHIFWMKQHLTRIYK